MGTIPCWQRLFPYRMNAAKFYPPYLRWLRNLSERLGLNNAISLWEDVISKNCDALLTDILSSGWIKTASGEIAPEASIREMVAEALLATIPELSSVEIETLIENTPPIRQIKERFSYFTVEKEITAYEALHLRFDHLAYLAEAIIKKYGKQGELIVYDILVEERLASSRGERGSVEEFIETFIAKPETPNLITAGLETELISRTKREAILYVRECEWARYYQERHPQVGYLMACSTDEVAYKAFNPDLRMQRTQTLMEGGEMCDFKVFAINTTPPG